MLEKLRASYDAGCKGAFGFAFATIVLGVISSLFMREHVLQQVLIETKLICIIIYLLYYFSIFYIVKLFIYISFYLVLMIFALNNNNICGDDVMPYNGS